MAREDRRVAEGWSRASILAAGLSNVECPALGPDGWILNVCSLDRPSEPWPTRGGEITATHPDRALETQVLFSTSSRDVSGIPAALAFGPDEAIYVADEGRRSIVRVEPSGRMEDFITHFGEERLNGPNDLSFDVNGDLYFTDPWTSSPNNPIAGVYGFKWADQSLRRVDTGMQFTNGIVVSEGRLFVAETFSRSVWVYDLEGNRPARPKRLFCRLPEVKNPPTLPVAVQATLGVSQVVGPDGMALDAVGNLWVAHYGGSAVFVYDDRGRLSDVLPVPGAKPTNLCFAGPELSLTYVAVDDPGVIMEYDIGARGNRLNFCPSRVERHSWSSVIADQAVRLPGRRELTRVEPPDLTLSH